MFLPAPIDLLWPEFCYSQSSLVGDVLKHLQCKQAVSELLPGLDDDGFGGMHYVPKY